MGQKKVKSGTKESITIKVTFDKSIWGIINNDVLGKSDSGKINHICVSWLSEQGILGGAIKKRMGL